MTSEFSQFTARLCEFISISVAADEGSLPSVSGFQNRPPPVGCDADKFNALALELFALQFTHNAFYRRICEARSVLPESAGHWTEIPAVPTTAFKEFEISCLPAARRTTVFHSSGTTVQQPSRHFHNAASLAVYETSLLPWFELHVVPDLKFEISDPQLVILTPPPAHALHSSLVHMLDVVRRKFGAPESVFVGQVVTDGSWNLDFEAALAALESNSKPETRNPKLILGTAFLFVHLLDELAARELIFELPAGSRVMETGGYKGRSRSVPRAELHVRIAERLGIPPTHIVCEYGMSELSSQAYDLEVQGAECGTRNADRIFRFPPWARAQIISPETGLEVNDGEPGLIRVCDLANVFSVEAIQTEDLGVRHGDGFELVGRAELAGPRGCSLMTA